MAFSNGGLSWTAVFARLAAPAQRLWTARSAPGAAQFADLPDDARADLQQRLTPSVERLLTLRAETVAEVDAATRWAVPLSALVILAVAWVTTGSLVMGMIMGVAGAGGVYWMVAMRPAARYEVDVRRAFGHDLADYLSDFTYEAEGFFKAGDLDGWKLFPTVVSPIWFDRMTGTRDGRDVRLFRMQVTYHVSGSGRSRKALSLDALCAEVAAGPAPGGVVLLLPRWAGATLRAGPPAHELTAVAANDEEISKFYEVFAEDPRHLPEVLTPDRCARVTALAEGHAARHRDRVPVLVFAQGRLSALFPLQGGLRLFQAPPFWQPLDPDAVLARFASDLAIKHAMLMDTLAVARAGSVQGPHD